MQENRNDVIEIAAVIRLILSKIKWVIALVLVALIVGAAAGAVLAPSPVRKLNMTFSVNGAVLNGNILSVLSSDSFAETFLLDENGLPADKKGTPEYDTAKEAIELYKTNLTKLKNIDSEIAALQEKVSVLASNKATQEAIRDSAANALLSPTLKDEDYKKIVDEYAAAKAEYEKLAQEHIDALTKENEKKEEKRKLNDNLDGDIEKAEDKANLLLVSWREQEQDNIKKIRDSLSFSYPSDVENNKFIYVTISTELKSDKDGSLMAKLEKLPQLLPSFLEKSLATTASGSLEAPSCRLTSLDANVREENRLAWVQDAVIYSVVAAVAMMVLVFAIAFIAVFFKSLNLNEPEAKAVASAPEASKLEESEKGDIKEEAVSEKTEE